MIPWGWTTGSKLRHFTLDRVFYWEWLVVLISAWLTGSFFLSVIQFPFQDNLFQSMYYPLQLKFLETVHTLCGRIPQVFLKQIEKTMRRAYEKHVIIHMGPNSMSWVPPLLWVSLASVTEDMDRMLPGYLCVCRFTGALWLLRFKCLVTFCLSCLSLKGNVLFFIVFKYYLSFLKKLLSWI